MNKEWVGPNPLFMVLWANGGVPAIIDLDEVGWKTKYAEALAACQERHLMRKADNVAVLGVAGHDWTYAARNFVFNMVNKVTVYGFIKGKEEAWYVPWLAMVVNQDEIDALAIGKGLGDPVGA